MILCLARIPPNPNGSGGSQRAWFLVEALSRIGEVYLVLLYPEADRSVPAVGLDAVRAVVKSLTVIPVAEWSATKDRIPWLPWSLTAWMDVLRLRSMDAPHLGRAALRRIAQRLPVGEADVVVAIRPSSAVIAGRLFDLGLLATRRKVADMDDIVSRYRRRQVAAHGPEHGRWWRRLMLVDAVVMARAEASICTQWDVVSLCSDDDLAALARASSATTIVKVANVVDRPLLRVAPHAGFRVLFVGNLGFDPNRQGLMLFLRDAWPDITRQNPEARLIVVGLSPPADLVAALAIPNVELHRDVASVEPYYATCDAVIAPITFGTGTRIKILEAMALGRPLVATRLAAEGLGLENDRHALIADTMPDFAKAVLRLGADPELRGRIAREGRRLQEEAFGVSTLQAAVKAMVAGPG